MKSLESISTADLWAMKQYLIPKLNSFWPGENEKYENLLAKINCELDERINDLFL